MMQYNKLLEDIQIQEHNNQITEDMLSNWLLLTPITSIVPGQDTTLQELFETLKDNFKKSSFLIHPTKNKIICKFKEESPYFNVNDVVLMKYIGTDELLLQIDPDYYIKNNVLILKDEIKQFLFKNDLNLELENIKIHIDREQEFAHIITIRLNQKLLDALHKNKIHLEYDQADKLTYDRIAFIDTFKELKENTPIIENKQEEYNQIRTLLKLIVKQKKEKIDN